MKRSSSTSIEYQLGTKWETKLWKLTDRDILFVKREIEDVKEDDVYYYRIPRHDFYWKEELATLWKRLKRLHSISPLLPLITETTTRQGFIISHSIYVLFTSRFTSYVSICPIFFSSICNKRSDTRKWLRWSTTTGRNPIAREIDASVFPGTRQRLLQAFLLLTNTRHVWPDSFELNIAARCLPWNDVGQADRSGRIQPALNEFLIRGAVQMETLRTLGCLFFRETEISSSDDVFFLERGNWVLNEKKRVKLDLDERWIIRGRGYHLLNSRGMGNKE